MKVAFIGGGTMAAAMIRGMLDKGICAAADITVGEPVAERRHVLDREFSVSAMGGNAQAVASADLVVLAIKPQHLGSALADLKGRLQPHQMVLSIVAGATIEQVSQGLGHTRLIRAMPNTPAQVGAGMSVWTCTDAVGEEGRDTVRAILRTLGEELYVDDERYVDMATALSASGPAYVFLFLESLADAGVYLGMSREMAQALALQTVLGSALLAKETGRQPAELRNLVTSPGGTTAEALLALEQAGFRAAVVNAVAAAHEKALELGEEA
ncbi:MAG: pyrroline-5-carboxylate reductase [Dehalococcoidia bacterium]